MNLLISLAFIALVVLTVKPFDLLNFGGETLESPPIQAQVLKQEEDEIKQEAKKEDMAPEPVEEEMTEMGLGSGFAGEGMAIAGLGGSSMNGQGAGVVRSAKLIKRVDPVYPERAKQAQITGSVTVKIHVSESGEVLHSLIVSSEPAGLFDQSAVTAIEKWKFEPAVKNGKRVASYLIQKVSFKLEN